MFRTFFHINEYGLDGWRLLPGLIAFSEEVTIWSPSGRMLKRAFDSGATSLSPRDILKAIEAGSVRVVTRENWIDGKSWRSADLQPDEYEGRLWQDYFDDELLRLARESTHTGKSNVIIVPPEDGYAWADEQIASQSPSYSAAKDLAFTRAVPLGTYERVGRAGYLPAEIDKACRIILRDSKNHSDAKRAVGANISVDMSDEPLWNFNLLADDTPTPLGKARRAFSEERVRSVLQLLLELTNQHTIETLSELSKSEKIREEIYDLVCSEEDLRFQLRKEIENGFKSDHSLSEKLGFEPGHPWLAVAALLTGFIGVWDAVKTMKRVNHKGMDRRELLRLIGGATVSSVGFYSSAVAPATYLARQLDVLPAGIDYSGPVFPFLPALGKDSPTRRQIEQMLEKLK